MSWENYGKWHVDHIKPFYLWDLSKTEEINKANALENLQCLWLHENSLKNSNYDPDHPMGWRGFNNILSEQDKEHLSSTLGYVFD